MFSGFLWQLISFWIFFWIGFSSGIGMGLKKKASIRVKSTSGGANPSGSSGIFVLDRSYARTHLQFSWISAVITLPFSGSIPVGPLGLAPPLVDFTLIEVFFFKPIPITELKPIQKKIQNEISCHKNPEN